MLFNVILLCIDITIIGVAITYISKESVVDYACAAVGTGAEVREFIVELY